MSGKSPSRRENGESGFRPPDEYAIIPSMTGRENLTPVPQPMMGDIALARIVRELSRVQDYSGGIAFIYDFLKTHFHLSALALEVAAGSGTRFHPCGDIPFLTELTLLDDPTSVPGVYVYPLNNLYAPPGELTFVFSPELEAPTELLEACTTQIAQILAQETLLRRAEDAEDKARQRITELATIYEIGQAIDQVEPVRVLQIITDRTAQLMDAQACSLMLVEPETETLRVVACYGLPEEALHKEQPLGEGIDRKSVCREGV